ncbi:MAG: hypothetical protein NTV87_08755 [Ignavibacteriae bacterium]|nr:hypothetical protein [Ignavibacteriota bacterium]
MGKIINLIIFAFIVYISTALYTGCETPIYQIVGYSGSWKFDYKYDNGTPFGQSILTIQDTGSFCGKFMIISTGGQYYVKGRVTADGLVYAGFANGCDSVVTGNISGTFTELMGAGYASGKFSDTLRNSAYKGTWQARRN